MILALVSAVAVAGSRVVLASAPGTPCSSVTLAATPAQPAAPGTEINLSGTARCGATPSYAYFERGGTSGPWTLISGWTAGSYTFDTRGLSDGSYQFLVWASDGPLTIPQAETAISYSLVAPTPCSAISASANPNSPLGIPATITAAAACPAAPVYAYFYAPAGGHWVLAQGWTADPSFSYDTNTWAVGEYNLLVWVTDESQATPQLQAVTSYTVTRAASGCSGGGLVAATSAAVTGAPETVTVSADCVPGYLPSYAFFRSRAGGGWTLVRAWTAFRTFTYSTAGWPAGTYQLMAWVGEKGGAPLAETGYLSLTLYGSGLALAAADPGPGKVIIVHLAAESLTAYDNGQVVLTTPITAGMPGLRTPTGIYSIYWKQTPYLFISPWPPGSRYYYHPEWANWVMNFLTGGFFIHDAPWEAASVYGLGSENGVDASHGCVQVPYSAMKFLYGWTPDGARVVITG
jgi:hypothetical protein